jgi:hypothetical protein
MSDDDAEPAAPPPAAVVVNDDTPRLFTPGQVAVATLLGSALGGGIVMAINARRTGRPFLIPLAAGLGLTLAQIALASMLPAMIGPGILFGGVFSMRAYAQQEAAKGGPTRRGSWAPPIAVGVAVASLWLGAAFVVGYFDHPQQMDFGAGQHVVYTKGVTDTDARKLGDTLKELGLFDGSHPVEIGLARDGDTWAISFVLQDGKWDDPQAHAFFASLRDELERRLGWARLEVRLCDDQLKPQRVF